MQRSNWRFCSNSSPPGGVPWLYLQLSSCLVLFLSFRSRKSGSPALAPLIHFSLSLLLRKKVTRWSISSLMTSHTCCHPGRHIPSVARYCSLSSLFKCETFLRKPKEAHLTCLEAICVSATWLQSLSSGGKGGPYLHWVNTTPLFSTSTAK